MATDRRQAVQDKGNKNRIIYKGLWTADEDAMLRSLVGRMADLPRCAAVPLRLFLSHRFAADAIRAAAATRSGSRSARR